MKTKLWNPLKIRTTRTSNPFNLISLPKRISKSNLSWSQAKVRYPKLNPFRDTDRDGIKNWADCRPFNKLKQDEGFEPKLKSREYDLEETKRLWEEKKAREGEIIKQRHMPSVPEMRNKSFEREMREAKREGYGWKKEREDEDPKWVRKPEWVEEAERDLQREKEPAAHLPAEIDEKYHERVEKLEKIYKDSKGEASDIYN